MTIWTFGSIALSLASSCTWPFRDFSHSTHNGTSMLVICKTNGAPRKSLSEKFFPSEPVALKSGALTFSEKTGLMKQESAAKDKRKIRAIVCSFFL